MGLLAKQEENNILIQNGFKRKAASVTGYLHDCYEKYIDLDAGSALVDRLPVKLTAPEENWLPDLSSRSC